MTTTPDPAFETAFLAASDAAYTALTEKGFTFASSHEVQNGVLQIHISAMPTYRTEATMPIAAPEYSNPFMTRGEDGTVSVTWGVRGTKACTIVADELIDEMAADKNRIAALEAALRDFVEDTPCSLDHHGTCQAHNMTGPPCANAVAKTLLGMEAS